MAKLVWDKEEARRFETGVDHGVLYVVDSSGTYGNGVAWNGLTGVTETPSGAEDNDIWADNIKYVTLKSAEDFGLTIECVSYPDEWMECDGSKAAVKGVVIGQQPRKKFGLTYRTKVGNAKVGQDAGYKLHLVYGCSAATSDRGYSTVNDSPDVITFSYEVSTTPVNVGKVGEVEYQPTSLITIDSTAVKSTELADLEDTLYGADDSTTAPTLPDPATVIGMFS